MDYLKFDCEKLRLDEVETHSPDGKTTYVNQYVKYGDKKKDLNISIPGSMLKRIKKNKFNEKKVDITLEKKVQGLVFSAIDDFLKTNKKTIIGEREGKFKLKPLETDWLACEVLMGKFDKPIDNIVISLSMHSIWVYDVDDLKKYGMKLFVAINNKD